MEDLHEEDLRVEIFDNSTYFRTECSVRITHIPTGIMATADVPPCRSQIEAKAKCLTELRELLFGEWPEYVNETDAQRYERFREGNDALWGEGNWIECPVCLDGRGKPSFHHKEMHGTINT